MKLLRNTFLIISTAFMIQSCMLSKCNFRVYSDRISTNCSLHNGVEIKRISNIRKFENNIPAEYDIDAHTTCGTNSMDILGGNMKKKLKTLYFHKENEGYKWIYHGHGKVTNTMPFKLESNNWYIFTRLFEHGTASVILFIYVDEKEKINTFRRNRVTNW